jgi:transglutaminase-like putative cysteine protease
MPIYHVKHTTRYSYPSTVTDSANQIILSPPSDDYQEIINHEIKIKPLAVIDNYEDFFGNKVGIFTIVEPHTDLVITVDAEVETRPVPVPSDFWSPQSQWETIDKLSLEVEFLDFVKSGIYKALPIIRGEISTIANREKTILQCVQGLSSYVYDQITYQQGVTDVETDIDRIWELKAGVCQDFAHLLLEMLRISGIPAKYVSGYICPFGNELRGIGATHAWVEAYIPDYGWLGIDPTNNCLISDRHIRIAFGRNFNDCTPVKGTYKGSSAHTLTVSVVITNEKIKNEEESTILHDAAAYVQQVVEPVAVINSYQRFIEMQQQQQQQ